MGPDDSIRGAKQVQPTVRIGPGLADVQPPGPVPDHLLLRPIGGGSYGTVWLARNTMGTYRAVKIVSRTSFVDQAPFDRELSGIRRFEPVSRSHEGFVDVLQVGLNVERGYFYYVMELGDDQQAGQSIDPQTYAPKTLANEIAARGRLSFRECLELGLALSHALAELHRHGLVHRDIKPSNIIFVQGVPKLADIGLVAEADTARSFVGTEGFIPPEGPGTAQADVYSLGKVLYECSTGRDRQEFPELPTLLDQLPDYRELLELNEVILQACKNEPALRYRSAWELHADLLVLANGKSVRRLKLLERRWSKFKKFVGMSGLAALVVAGIAFQAYREWRQAMESRQRQVGAYVAFGTRAMESGDRLSALPFFAEALSLDQGNRDHERMHRLRFGSALAQCPKLEQMWFVGREVNDASFNPSGRNVLVTEWVGKARLFDLQTGKPIGSRLEQTERLERSSYSPDGRRVVTASENNTADAWNVSDGERLLSLAHPDKVLCANFSPDGLRIVTGCKDNVARVWDARTGEVRLILPPHQGAVLFVNFSPDGRYIVTTSRDNTARIWDVADGTAVGPPLQHPTWVGYAAFDPSSHAVVTACFDHRARVWDVASGKRLLVDLDHKSGVTSAEFSPDGRLILTASLDGTARVWDAANPLADSNIIVRHSAGLTRASFARDGHRIITACTDGSVRVWDLAGSTVPPVGARPSASPDGSRFLILTNGGIQVCDTVSGKPVSPPMRGESPLERSELSRDGRFGWSISLVRTNPVSRVLQAWESGGGHLIGPSLPLSNGVTACISDDGRRLMTYGGKVAQLWEVASGKALSPSLLHDDPVEVVAFSRDASRAATAAGHSVRVWDAGTGRELFPALSQPMPVVWVEFSPDSAHLVSCCADDQFTRGFAQVWEAATGQPVGTRLEHADGVLRATFSPDGRRVATASEDFTAAVWDLLSGRRVTPALKHDNHVQAVAFSPDGGWVVTASPDKTARVWSAESGEPLTPPLRQPGRLANARFLGDGHRIVTSDKTGHSWMWDLPVDDRPVADLILLSHLFSGTRVNQRGEKSPADVIGEALWRRMREKYPADFITSAEEITAWRALQAQDSEEHGQWLAAAFKPD